MATGMTLATTTAGSGTASGSGTFGLWALFSQSFDAFTVALIAGSIVGIALIVRCAMEVREKRVLPEAVVSNFKDLAERGRLGELRDDASGDRTFLGRTVSAALAAPVGGRREAAELVASEQCARLFRAIEPLNVIGNLGPLVGLAGTVWGMILAFTSLGETGGQAGAADLSLGISKALFHTLLGLLLAIPCLLAYGLFRGMVDRVCNRGMILAGEIVDRIEVAAAAGGSNGNGAAVNGVSSTGPMSATGAAMAGSGSGASAGAGAGGR